MQRIVAGRLRGRKLLPLPEGVDGLRPTAARVREAICHRLQFELVGARVLDLFAGSGALSFEALSRGATEACLVDADPRVARHLKRQLEALELQHCARVVQAEAVAFATELQTRFDVVFIDPPFAIPEICEPLAIALDHGALAPGAVVVCERERIRGKSPPVAWPEHWQLEAVKIYGQAQVEFLRFHPLDPTSHV